MNVSGIWEQFRPPGTALFSCPSPHPRLSAGPVPGGRVLAHPAGRRIPTRIHTPTHTGHPEAAEADRVAGLHVTARWPSSDPGDLTQQKKQRIQKTFSQSHTLTDKGKKQEQEALKPKVKAISQHIALMSCLVAGRRHTFWL